MTPEDGFLQPPRIATWLVVMFASAEKESLEGDLFEEFSDLASRSGAAVARRWYWRQALQSIVHLGIGAFRAAPYSTTAVVIAGFLLGRVLFRLTENGIFAVLERYRVFDTHFGLYVFFTSDGLAAAHVATSMLVGCFVAFMAKGKEMIATVTLVLLLFGMTCVSSWVWVARGNGSMLWSMLPWIFLDWFAMLVGGAFIRMQRTASRKSSRT